MLFFSFFFSFRFFLPPPFFLPSSKRPKSRVNAEVGLDEQVMTKFWTGMSY